MSMTLPEKRAIDTLLPTDLVMVVRKGRAYQFDLRSELNKYENQATDLSIENQTSTELVLKSSTGNSVTLGLATGDFAGLYSAEHFTKVSQLPTATALTSALSGKVDKVAGRGLSEANFSLAQSNKLDALPTANALEQSLDTKVDAVPGKGLSTNDYDDAAVNAVAAAATKQELTSGLSGKVDRDGAKVLTDVNFTQAMSDKLAGLEESRFKGEFVSYDALVAAVPTAEPGAYANVDAGEGADVERYVWDSSDSKWVKQLGESTQLTGAQVKQLYESQPDTNAFKDSDLSKLNALPSRSELTSEFAEKVSVVPGKGLSDVNFTAGQASKLNALPTASELNTEFNTKVEKVEGKGLSTNDFTDADVLRLGSTVSSSELSAVVQSTNEALDEKEPVFQKNTAFNRNFGSGNEDVPRGNDARFADAREWSAATVTPAEIETGAGTNRRAWTIDLVFTAATKWWSVSNAKMKLDALPTAEQLTNSLAEKVDKVVGFGLSEANFTAIEKTKLSELGTNGKGNVTYSTAMPTQAQIDAMAEGDRWEVLLP